MALQNYKAIWGQSIFDITLQVYGTLDLLYKLIQDSDVDSVNDVPLNGQIYIYDDALVTDQALINKNLLSGIIYATELGSNGSAYYIIRQKVPNIIPPPVPIGPIPPINPVPAPTEDMAVYGTSFTSGADGTTVIAPLDANGNSMANGNYSIVQLEKEIKPLTNAQFQWNTLAGTITLLGGLTLDKGQTLYIIYSLPVS